VRLVTRLSVRGRAIESMWWGPLSSDRLPIVLLHEGLGSVSLWKDVPEAIASQTGRRTMAYSRFGHGASDPPPLPHTPAFLHEEAHLLPEILDACGIARAILLGHSDGGSIALLGAAMFPDRVEAMILEAPHVFVEDIGIASIEHRRTQYTSSDLRERLKKYHAHVDVAFTGWCDVWLDPSFRSWNIEDRLPAIACPVLIIQGKQDRYATLTQVDAVERKVAGPVERLVLDGCGHTPHRDQRTVVLDAVARFVSQMP
jgi:pimeloyl-ACP methyl ester carboxylesterase